LDNQNELDSLFSQPIEQDIDLEAGKLLDTIDFNRNNSNITRNDHYQSALRTIILYSSKVSLTILQ